MFRLTLRWLSETSPGQTGETGGIRSLDSCALGSFQLPPMTERYPGQRPGSLRPRQPLRIHSASSCHGLHTKCQRNQPGKVYQSLQAKSSRSGGNRYCPTTYLGSSKVVCFSDRRGLRCICDRNEGHKSHRITLAECSCPDRKPLIGIPGRSCRRLPPSLRAPCDAIARTALARQIPQNTSQTELNSRPRLGSVCRSGKTPPNGPDLYSIRGKSRSFPCFNQSRFQRNDGGACATHRRITTDRP